MVMRAWSLGGPELREGGRIVAAQRRSLACSKSGMMLGPTSAQKSWLWFISRRWASSWAIT